MPTEKTIKVSEEVHSELERLKHENRDDSFDTVLKRALGLVSTSDAAMLGAYFPLEEHREAAQSVIEHIRSLRTLDERVEPDARYDGILFNEGLEFEIGEESRTIATIGFQEDRFHVFYLNPKKKLTNVAIVRYDDSEDTVEYDTESSSNDYFEDELADILDAVDQKVSGALRRWN